MSSFRTLLVKFLMVAVVLWIILGLFGFSFGDILIASVLLTGVSFVVGDLFVLPRFGNGAALVGDFILTFALIWMLSAYLFGYTGRLGYLSFITATVITIGEALFHRYMERTVFDNMTLHDVNPDFNRMQTEFGDEPDFKEDKRKKNVDKDKSELTKEKHDFYNK